MTTIGDLVDRLERAQADAERRRDHARAERAEHLKHQLLACVSLARESDQAAGELTRRAVAVGRRVPSAIGEVLTDAEVQNEAAGRDALRYLAVLRGVNEFLASQQPPLDSP